MKIFIDASIERILGFNEILVKDSKDFIDIKGRLMQDIFHSNIDGVGKKDLKKFINNMKFGENDIYLSYKYEVGNLYTSLKRVKLLLIVTIILLLIFSYWIIKGVNQAKEFADNAAAYASSAESNCANAQSSCKRTQSYCDDAQMYCSDAQSYCRSCRY